MDETPRNRVIAAVLGLATLTPLLVAANLTPADAGLGTHEQLGLPECGFQTVTGSPCVTCGMTTAFAHATHGRLGQAVVTQPAGTVMCVACAMLALVSAWACVSGMSLRPLGRSLGRPAVVFGGLGVLLLSWCYTIWAHLGG